MVTDHTLYVFSICDQTLTITQEPYRADFFGNIIWTWAEFVEFGKSGDSVRYYCTIMHNTAGTSLDKLLAFMDHYYEGDYCVGGYEEYIAYYNASGLTTNACKCIVE